jgi:hypothetical protein
MKAIAGKNSPSSAVPDLTIEDIITYPKTDDTVHRVKLTMS